MTGMSYPMREPTANQWPHGKIGEKWLAFAGPHMHDPNMIGKYLYCQFLHQNMGREPVIGYKNLKDRSQLQQCINQWRCESQLLISTPFKRKSTTPCTKISKVID